MREGGGWIDPGWRRESFGSRWELKLLLGRQDRVPPAPPSCPVGGDGWGRQGNGKKTSVGFHCALDE